MPAQAVRSRCPARLFCSPPFRTPGRERGASDGRSERGTWRDLLKKPCHYPFVKCVFRVFSVSSRDFKANFEILEFVHHASWSPRRGGRDAGRQDPVAIFRSHGRPVAVRARRRAVSFSTSNACRGELVSDQAPPKGEATGQRARLLASPPFSQEPCDGAEARSLGGSHFGSPRLGVFVGPESPLEPRRGLPGRCDPGRTAVLGVFTAALQEDSFRSLASEGRRATVYFAFPQANRHTLCLISNSPKILNLRTQ